MRCTIDSSNNFLNTFYTFLHKVIFTYYKASLNYTTLLAWDDNGIKTIKKGWRKKINSWLCWHIVVSAADTSRKIWKACYKSGGQCFTLCISRVTKEIWQRCFLFNQYKNYSDGLVQWLIEIRCNNEYNKLLQTEWNIHWNLGLS